MHKYFFSLYTGYVGETAREVIAFREKPTEKELDEIGWEMACQNADMFSHESEYDEGEYESQDEFENRVDFHFVEYDPEAHDRYSTTGSWDNCFEM